MSRRTNLIHNSRKVRPWALIVVYPTMLWNLVKKSAQIATFVFLQTRVKSKRRLRAAPIKTRKKRKTQMQSALILKAFNASLIPTRGTSSCFSTRRSRGKSNGASHYLGSATKNVVGMLRLMSHTYPLVAWLNWSAQLSKCVATCHTRETDSWNRRTGRCWWWRSASVTCSTSTRITRRWGRWVRVRAVARLDSRWASRP